MWPAPPPTTQPLKRRKSDSAWSDAPNHDFETFQTILAAADAGAMLRRQARLERRAARPVENVSVFESVLGTLEAMDQDQPARGLVPATAIY